jgi:hypothetical protein
MRPAPDRSVRYSERARKLASPLLAVESEARLAKREGGKAHKQFILSACPDCRTLANAESSKIPSGRGYPR